MPPTAVDDGYLRARAAIGRFNLGFFGLTGVGKSTLLNAVFGAELAATGIGDPVTQGSTLYRHESTSLGVFDTKGLEIGDDNGAILRELRQFVDQNRLGSISDQIHVIWYCVRAGDRRIQPAEEDFIRQVAELGIPVLLVLTQTALTPAGEVHLDSQQLAAAIAARDLPVRGLYFVNAKADDFAGVPAHGLEELLAATAAVAPEGVLSALAAAQRVSQQYKRDQAQAMIAAADRDVSARFLVGRLGTRWAQLFAAIAEIYDMPEVQSRRVLFEAQSILRLRRMIMFGNAGLFVGMMAPAAIVTMVRKARPAKEEPSAEKQRIRTGFAAGQVTRAIGEAWMETCEHYWSASFPSAPQYPEHEPIAKHFADELNDRLPFVLRKMAQRNEAAD